MDKYDVVVIGCGIGGLTCALLLAKKGMRVAVFEKGANPGGYCSSFSVNGYRFDACIDSIGGLRSDEPLWHILKNELGILEKIGLYELNPTRRNIFPDMTVDIPGDITQYKEILKSIFPAEKEGIDKFFFLMEETYLSSIQAVYDNAASELLLNLINKSYYEVLASFIHDQKLQAALSSYCTFLGLTSKEVSMIAASNILMHYVRGGTFRIRGGIQELINILVNELGRYGGKVFLNEEITAILCENGKLLGVITKSGKEVNSKEIISDIDIKTALRLMKSCSLEKEKVNRVERLEVSGSFVVVYLGVKNNLHKYNFAPSMGYFSSYDLDAMLNETQHLSFGFSVPSSLDASLAPIGHSAIVIHCPFCYNNIKSTSKDTIGNNLIKELAKIIPDIMDYIEYQSIAGPDTLRRYTGNTSGAAYGWKQDVNLFESAPLLKSLFDKFHIVGHWAGYGGGIMPSMLSAVSVSKIIGDGV